MSITANGIPWDQETFRRIERKGGCHYRSNCADYVDLERKVEAHELRYADRVEVYGSETFNGMRITDSVVVLNGGTYMSTGIKPAEDVAVVGAEPIAPANERVHNDGRVWTEDDDRLRQSLGMDLEQWREWNPGGGWSEPRPISEPGQQLGAYFAAQAAYHRRRARIWLGVAIACALLAAVVLLAPSDWIYFLFEAME